MRQEVVVEDELRPLALVVLGLVGCQFLADIHDTALDRVAFTLLEVLHHEGEDILIRRDRVYDFLVIGHAQCAHQVHEFQVAGNGRKRDLEEVLLVPLDNNQCPVPPELGEYLGNINPLIVAFGELRHDLVGCKILQGHEHALGTIDDEITAGIKRVFPMGDALGIIHTIKVAGERPDHDRELPDRGDDRVLPVLAVHERQAKLDRRGIRQVAQACLGRVEFPLRSVCFPYQRFFDLDGAQFNPDGLVVLAPVLDISLDNPLLVDHFLKIVF